MISGKVSSNRQWGKRTAIAVTAVIVFASLSGWTMAAGEDEASKRLVSAEMSKEVGQNGKPGLTLEEQHWAYNDLKSFKQRILAHVAKAKQRGWLKDEDWNALQKAVFDWKTIDHPIRAEDWGKLLRLTLELDAVKDVPDVEQSISMYVAAFVTTDGYLLREDAAGGLFKLLTVRHIIGSAWAEELKPAYVLRDLPQAKEQQQLLIQSLYIRGLLDGKVIDTFRPKETLTNAEALSMLNRVLEGYDDVTEKWLIWPEAHWSWQEIGYSVKPGRTMLELNRFIRALSFDLEGPDSPVTPEHWHKLLAGTLAQLGSKQEDSFIRNYTTKLVGNSSTVPRDKAVVAIMKLWPANPRDAEAYELEGMNKAFSDAKNAFDPSKLAQAYYLDLVRGYDGGAFHPEKSLTNAEALVLTSRLLAKGSLK